jgi:hypothetical protein
MTEAEIRQKCGWVHLPLEIDAVLATLPVPRFDVAAAHLLAEPPPEAVFLWDACKKVTGGHLAAHDQDGVGCCVGEGFSSAVEYLQCVEIALGNEPEEYRPISSESVYGLSRVEIGGGRISGDGSTGAWAAKAVQDYGVLPRALIGDVDLRHFSPQRARQWGDRGLPSDLEREARLHPVRTVSLVRSFAEARAAIAHGYPVAVCSDQGFGLKRDGDGFCPPLGRWGHCMCFIGAVGGSRPGLCCLQSWGPTTPGGPIGIGDHPACAFWVDAAIADRMLGEGDSWALSAFQGFPARRLDWVI